MTLPWRFSVPAGQLPFATIDEMVEMCRCAGITAIEGQVRAFEPLSKQDSWENLAGALGDAGVSVSTFHLPFGPAIDLANFYETERRAAVETTRQWIEDSARLGCKLGITHPNSCPASVDVEGVERFMDQLARSVDDLLPTLREHDYTIAIENMPPGPHRARFGARVEHFERMASRLDDPHVGFCLDTGHALMCEPEQTLEGFIEAMSPRLIAYHLADNAGDRDSHLAPGHGLVDWPSVFGHMERLGYTGVACIETPPFARGPAYSVEAWRGMLERTAELAANALGVNTAAS